MFNNSSSKIVPFMR